MKKVLIAMIAVVAMPVGIAQAEVVLFDDFNYAPGILGEDLWVVGDGPWAINDSAPYGDSLRRHGQQS